MSFDLSARIDLSARRRAAGSVPALARLPVAVAIGGGIVFAMTLATAVAVWRTGIFTGPDDAMRAVEVRDLIGGQGWFDLVPKRLSPDHPFAMHWSRLADLPLAAAMLGLRQLTDAATAERLTRLVEPALFYLLFLTALASLARDLCGRWAALAVTMLAAGSLDIVGDFMPGRIHHHALQILLLTLMAKLACDGLDPERPGRLGWAGAVAALSLGINLQNMPFVAATAGIVAILWAGQGARLADGLERFGLGLALGATAVFVVQVPPGRYGAGTCDAFAAPHLVAAWIGAVAFVALARTSGRLGTSPRRAAALGIAGIVALAVLRATYPACLGDPYAAVDPLVRTGWMAEVGEAMRLTQLLVLDPYGTVPIVIALVLGVGSIVGALRFERGLTRSRWILLAGLAIVAIAGACWQIRVAASAEVFAALGGAWLLVRLFDEKARARPYGTLLAVVGGLALTPAGWTAAATVIEPARIRTPVPGMSLGPVESVRCFEPSSYDGLRQLRPGLVLSTIDPGAHILAETAQSAIAAPYHRDTYGIRLALQVFDAPTEDARGLVASSRADTIALCTASPEVYDIVRRSPDGFAARILSGRLPPWLAPIPSIGPFRLYSVLPGVRP